MTPTLEDQERHLLVKVIDRILYKLDDLVRNYVHKILVVIEPLLIVEDYYARVEGLPNLKPEDMPYFDKLLDDVNEDELDPEQAKERKIMRLLLKIKNGTPPMRKAALRQLTDK
eukprot:Pgem_evm1s4177